MGITTRKQNNLRQKYFCIKHILPKEEMKRKEFLRYLAQRELPENGTDVSVKSVSKDLRILRALKDCNRMEEHKDKSC